MWSQSLVLPTWLLTRLVVPLPHHKCRLELLLLDTCCSSCMPIWSHILWWRRLFSCRVASVENHGGQTCVTAPPSTMRSFMLFICSACDALDVLAILIAAMLISGTAVDDDVACSAVTTGCCCWEGDGSLFHPCEIYSCWIFHTTIALRRHSDHCSVRLHWCCTLKLCSSSSCGLVVHTCNKWSFLVLCTCCMAFLFHCHVVLSKAFLVQLFLFLVLTVNCRFTVYVDRSFRNLFLCCLSYLCVCFFLFLRFPLLIAPICIGATPPL